MEADGAFPPGSTGVGPPERVTRSLVCPWLPPSALSLGERCRVLGFGSDVVLLDGPDVGGSAAITGSPEGESVTDARRDLTESARGGSACLESERVSMTRDLRIIDLTGAFRSGSTLLFEVDGGV